MGTPLWRSLSLEGGRPCCAASRPTHCAVLCAFFSKLQLCLCGVPFNVWCPALHCSRIVDLAARKSHGPKDAQKDGQFVNGWEKGSR